jgi:O-antigen/teichoic acid export membrane protein
VPRTASQERATASYGRAAALLSVALAATGLLTFGFFSAASHVLDGPAYKRIVLLWSVMFIVISTIYRPIEQLLSRTIAARRATGLHKHPLRVPAAIQGGFAVAFLAVALAARGPIQDNLFDGSTTLFWALVAGTTTYGAAFFARGWLAGHRRFRTLSALVFVDAAARLAFPLIVAAGTGGEGLVAVGVAAAPVLSLAVVPLAGRRGAASPTLAPAADSAWEGPGAEGAEEALSDVTLTRGAGFAVAVLGIMAAEQALLNVPVLTVDALAANGALAGFVFNVLLIARAPLQLFQAVQISLLPHLAGLEATEGREAFRHAVVTTGVAIAAFSGAVTLGLLAVGPDVMNGLFGGSFDYARGGLALMGLGMGFHLLAGTLNQAALARDRADAAATCWLIVGIAFIGWLLISAVDDQLLRVEAGYCGATALLTVLLALTRRPRPRAR